MRYFSISYNCIKPSESDQTLFVVFFCSSAANTYLSFQSLCDEKAKGAILLCNLIETNDRPGTTHTQSVSLSLFSFFFFLVRGNILKCTYGLVVAAITTALYSHLKLVERQFWSHSCVHLYFMDFSLNKTFRIDVWGLEIGN